MHGQKLYLLHTNKYTIRKNQVWTVSRGYEISAIIFTLLVSTVVLMVSI